jgi:LuxR family maltose regulon positive regulatory protein
MAEAAVPTGRAHLTSPQIPLLTTKLYIPPARPASSIVPRPRLVQRLNQDLHHKLSVIAAPAGFGKTTLLSEWIPQSEQCITWVSLDEGDNDPTLFWAYFITALQMFRSNLGENALSLLQSPPPPQQQFILTTLINEIAAFQEDFTLVLNDYHVIENQALHEELIFLIDHLPPQM